jgi:magnesium chelatase subunit I
LIKAARAYAAWKGDNEVVAAHIRKMAPLALSHRLRRNPLDDARSTVRVERALEEIFAQRSAA